jgi:membrane fusion protein, multidrug efflux system
LAIGYARHVRAPAPRILFVSLVLPALACGDGNSSAGLPGPSAPAVEVLTIAKQSFEEQADLLGELQAENSVLVRSEVPGIVETIDFQEGETVTQGRVLFHLRDREAAARLREAEAELLLGNEDFARTTKLASANAAAAAQLDKARATLEMARARADLRRVELDRTLIKAPFAGRVGARMVSPGARIKADDQLVRLDAMDPLALVFTIPEVVLPLAKIGAEFSLDVAAFPGRRWPGVIRFIAPNVDSASRRILIKGRVPNPDGVLLPGMFARVQASLGTRETLLIPDEALVADPEGTFVWRLGSEDKAERVAIEIGTREPGRVEVRSGLREGDRIVVAGTHKVHEGAKVKAVPAVIGGAAPAAPASAAAPGGGA